MSVVPNSSRPGRKPHSGKAPPGGWRTFPLPERNPYWGMSLKDQGFIDVFCSRPRAKAVEKLGYTPGSFDTTVCRMAAKLDRIAADHGWDDWDTELEPTVKLWRSFSEASRGSTDPDPREHTSRRNKEQAT